jgi:peptidase E
MIKVVLHGGRVGEENQSNDGFFAEFTNDIDKPVVKVAMCYWARKRDEWEEKCDRDVELIQKQSTKTVEYIVVENPDDLKVKLPECDVFYVAGGDAPPIERYYPDLSDLREMLGGKVYLGSSMGAFMVAKSYVLSMDSQDSNTVHEGTGLLPINILCHWKVEKKKQFKLDLLKKHDPMTTIMMLDEFEWVRCWV